MPDVPSPKPLVAGNWKMNGLSESLAVVEQVAAHLADGAGHADAMICPPAQLIAAAVRQVANRPLAIGGQDCHASQFGAHTGDISAEMLADVGASAVIVGHSERRADHGEADALIRDKAAAGHRAGLTGIICIGETAGQRAAGLTETVALRQLRACIPDGASHTNTVIAYEPVWAIGTGLVPTSDEIATTHGAIRRELKSVMAHGDAVRILYGGSVKPTNAHEILGIADVNGALVGGASLTAEDFLGIFAAYG